MARFQGNSGGDSFGAGLGSIGDALAAWGGAITKRRQDAAVEDVLASALAARREARQATEPGAPVVLGDAKSQLARNPFESPDSMLDFLSAQPNFRDILKAGKLGDFLALASHEKGTGLPPGEAKAYTPESIAAFQKSGNKDLSLLVPRPTAKSLQTKTVAISDTMQQEFNWNPETGDLGAPLGKPRPIFTPEAPRDNFVGAPFPSAEGDYLIRDRSGDIFRLTPDGPQPYRSGVSTSPLPAVPGATPYGPGATPTAGGGIRAPVAPLTESEAKNVGWEGRMRLGDTGIDQFLDANPDYLASWKAKLDQVSRTLGENGRYIGIGLGGALGAALTRTTIGAGVGAGVGGAAGEALGAVAEQFLTSDQGKEYIAKATPFVTSALRKDTGAVINNEEWTMAFREWLPLPGDPPSVINAKARNREAAIRGAAIGAGKGAGRAVTTPAAPSIADQWRKFE